MQAVEKEEIPAEAFVEAPVSLLLETSAAGAAAGTGAGAGCSGATAGGGAVGVSCEPVADRKGLEVAKRMPPLGESFLQAKHEQSFRLCILKVRTSAENVGTDLLREITLQFLADLHVQASRPVRTARG